MPNSRRIWLLLAILIPGICAWLVGRSYLSWRPQLLARRPPTGTILLSNTQTWVAVQDGPIPQDGVPARLVNLVSGTSWTMPEGFEPLVFSPHDERVLGCSCGDNTINLAVTNLRSGKSEGRVIFSLRGQNAPPGTIRATNFTWLSDTGFAAILGTSIVIWSGPQFKTRRTLHLPLNLDDGGEIDAESCAPDGELVATAYRHPSEHYPPPSDVYLFQRRTGMLVRSFTLNHGVTGTRHMEFSPDHQSLAILDNEYDILEVRSTSTGRQLWKAHAGEIVFAPGSDYVVTDGEGADRSYLLRKAASGEVVKRLGLNPPLGSDVLGLTPQATHLFFRDSAGDLYKLRIR